MDRDPKRMWPRWFQIWNRKSFDSVDFSHREKLRLNPQHRQEMNMLTLKSSGTYMEEMDARKIRDLWVKSGFDGLTQWTWTRHDKA